ncbi:unnamed protein product [Clonostachys byssicola]|uniref:Aminoglycoside phosphotransferase domain-containing protein n=1 Tax=Clonostachys byssicola TaxID=160290 RepID=A0A9N9UKV5_9HYPO|nr:unnamed protein product [Clonostachys byssicola]
MSDSSELGGIVRELSNAFAVDFPQPHSPMSGASHDVWLLDDPTNGETWSIRIAKNEFAASLSDRGAAILQYLKEKRPMLQVPKLLCQSKQYSVFQYLGGEPIDYWDSNKLSDKRRHHLLDSLAVFLFEMWTCPVPRGAIKHGDFSAWNVLMDDKGISGVIDWDTAQFVPMPAAIHHPLFIADIPGWQKAVPENMKFAKDRKYLQNAIAKIAGNSNHPDAQNISRLLSNCFERQFFELSLRSKLTNEHYIETRIKGSMVEKVVLQKQLGAFLAIYSGLRTNPTILALQERMRRTEGVSVPIMKDQNISHVA